MRSIDLNRKQADKKATYITRFSKALILVACIMFALTGKISRAEASSLPTDNSNTVNVSVDYLNELAVISTVSGSSVKYYISTDNKKSWDLVDPSGVIDISTLLQKKETTIYLKRNRYIEPTAVVLKAEDSTLKATYQVVSGEGFIVLSGNSSPVEIRKGTNGQWKPVTSPIATAIYEMKGASLSFRTVATTSTRAGMVVTVKVSKKPTAPSVKLDGSRLYISGLKTGETQYRVGDETAWRTFEPTDTKIKTLDIMELFGTAGALANTPIPAGKIEFRIKPGKKVASSVKIIEVPLQPTVPETINLNGTTLSISDTNLKKAYEYTRVEKGGTLSIKTAKWTGITAARSAIIPKTSVGDRIYVRLKSTTDPVSKVITPASTLKELTVITITVKP